MKKKEQQKLEDEFERDAQDPDTWEADPAPASGARDTLGTQVTVRLDARDASRLRRIAAAKRLGYTSLVREWIEDRLRQEDSQAELILPHVSQNGYAMSKGVVAASVSGMRWIESPDIEDRRVKR